MRRVGVVALVLAGIWALAQAIFWLYMPLAYLIDGGEKIHWRYALLFIPSTGAALLAVVLVAKRRALSEKLFDEQPAGTSLDISLLMRAGIAIVGIALAAFAVPRLIDNITRPFFIGGGGVLGSTWESFRMVLSNIIADGAQLILGIALAVFSRRLAGLFGPDRRRCL